MVIKKSQDLFKNPQENVQNKRSKRILKTEADDPDDKNLRILVPSSLGTETRK